MTVEQMEIEYLAYVCFLEGNPTLSQVAKRSKEVTDRIWGVRPVRNKRKKYVTTSAIRQGQVSSIIPVNK